MTPRLEPDHCGAEMERLEAERDDLSSRLRREGEELGEARRQLREAVEAIREAEAHLADPDSGPLGRLNAGLALRQYLDGLGGQYETSHAPPRFQHEGDPDGGR